MAPNTLAEMELHHLRAFEVVASLMSFHRAAEVLHCTQSTVSAQIKALEEDLGVRVFERLGRRIALTPAGQELLRHSRQLLEHERAVCASVRGTPGPFGMLSLRVPQSVSAAYLPRILGRFAHACPRVGLDVSNCAFHSLADELRSGVTDAAFLLADRLDTPELVSTRVRVEPLVFVAQPGSALTRRRGLCVRDLEGHPLLLPKHDCGYRMELERWVKEEHVELGALYELNCLSALVHCVREGLGVALVPRIAVQRALADQTLAALHWRAPVDCGLLFLRHRDKPLEGAFGTFVRIVEEFFAEEEATPSRPPRKARSRGSFRPAR